MSESKTNTIKTYFKVHIHGENQAKEFLDLVAKALSRLQGAQSQKGIEKVVGKGSQA